MDPGLWEPVAAEVMRPVLLAADWHFHHLAERFVGGVVALTKD